MRIEQVGDVPDLSVFRTIVITSKNGVVSVGSKLAGARVRTVGRGTAESARELGAEAEMLGEDSAGFLGNARDLDGPLLVVRGVHTRGDLAGRLREMGHAVEEATLYDQVDVPLTDVAETLLSGDGRVVAPVFSPRSAALLSARPIAAPVTVIAISGATAEAWRGPGNVRVAERPDAEAMCQAVAEAF